MRITKTVYGPLLKGEMVQAAGKTAVAGVILEVRKPANVNFGSPLIIDFDTDVLPGVNSWPVNMTSMRELAEKISDETDTWRGWGLVLSLAEARNPETKRMVPSLRIAKVIDPKTAKSKRKSKPTKTMAPSSRETGVPNMPDDYYDQVPF